MGKDWLEYVVYGTMTWENKITQDMITLNKIDDSWVIFVNGTEYDGKTTKGKAIEAIEEMIAHNTVEKIKIDEGKRNEN
jgi:hypothetical protein